MTEANDKIYQLIDGKLCDIDKCQRCEDLIKELSCLYSVLSEDEMHERKTSYSQWFAALAYKETRGKWMNKELKTLSQHNSDRHNMYIQMNDNSPRLNGIACPQCGKEMFDSSPNITLTSNPPQKNTHCECGYTGYRIA